MKKILFVATAAILFTNTACDPKGKTVQEEDTVSEEVLAEDEVSAQYQGSTGVLDEEDNNMDAVENIQIEKHEFKGSFATMKTQTYELTVIDEPKSYTFRLESGNPDVQYVVAGVNGDIKVDATTETQTVTLEPGQYNVMGTVETGDGSKVDPETSFTIYIE